MTWYYAKGSEQIGPVSRDEIEQLAKSGKINSRTLVWTKGMPEWAELGSLKQKTADSTPPPKPPVPATDMELRPKSENAPEGRMFPCAECGSSFPEDEMITYDGSRICAGCKPLFMQKLKEGVRVAGNMEYAGFWIRVGAKLIDGIIQSIINMIFYIPVGMITASIGSSEPGDMSVFTGIYLISFVIQMIVPILYNTWFVGKYGATPGKMACRLRIIRSDGARVSYRRAFGRVFAEWISAIFLGIGYLMAAFDQEKRALHDHICDTRVVYK